MSGNGRNDGIIGKSMSDIENGGSLRGSTSEYRSEALPKAGANTRIDALTARFFTTADERADSFVFPLPAPWWSRPYEYAWCAGFARQGDVVLDAACGISHPFKFYLADRCKEAHACDWDERIVSETEIYLDVVRDFGKGAAETLMRASSLSRLRRARASIAALPYPSGYFDTIFCISVLEHLSAEDLAAALGEFGRTLKPEGRLVLTFDYPTVDLAGFRELALRQGFDFDGGMTEALPPDALASELWGRLYCYRAVLRRRQAQD